MSDNNVQASGGIGLGSLLTVAFVVLKLTEHITWSWWWVFSPLWIPFGIVLVILIILGIIMAAYK